jgi:hypothetical protein
MISKFKTLAAAIALSASVLATPASACFLDINCTAPEPQGSSVSDSDSLTWKYSIKNTALFQVQYQFRWGNEPWRLVVLPPGARKTHSFTTGGARPPKPEVMFRQVDGSWSPHYKMSTRITKDEGMAGTSHPHKPRRYVFIYGDFQQFQLRRLVSG